MIPGTPDLLSIVAERLATDPDLSALLVGGLYKRELKRGNQAGNTYGATPEAFSPTNTNQLRPCAVVKYQPRTAIADYADRVLLEIWVYVPATEDGKAIQADAIRHIRTLLQGWNYATASGTGGTMRFVGQTGYRDDPVYQQSVVDTVTYAAVEVVNVPA